MSKIKSGKQYVRQNLKKIGIVTTVFEYRDSVEGKPTLIEARVSGYAFGGERIEGGEPTPYRRRVNKWYGSTWGDHPGSKDEVKKQKESIIARVKEQVDELRSRKPTPNPDMQAGGKVERK